MADAKIFKTIQFISKWMNAVESRPVDSNEGGSGENQGCDGGEFDDEKMIKFIKMLKN